MNARPFRTALLILALIGLAGPSTAQENRTVEVNGVTLNYVDDGKGSPVVFVPAALVDHRVWEPYREAIARDHRFISYTKRYFGTDPWSDAGEHFSDDTHVSDLAAFIRALDVGPVYLVSWSYSGRLAPQLALRHPEMVRGMVHYEPAVGTLVAGMPEELKTAIAEERKKYGPAMEALKAGEAVEATKLFIEAVFERPEGGFEQEPEYMRTIWLDNARTLAPMFGSPPNSITCDDLANIKQPTLIVKGEQTDLYYSSVADTMAQCQPDAELRELAGVGHEGPVHAVEPFTATILDFLASH